MNGKGARHGWGFLVTLSGVRLQILLTARATQQKMGRQTYIASLLLIGVLGIHALTYPSPLITLPLHEIGNSYGFQQILVGGIPVDNVVLDTGSSDFVIRTCNNNDATAPCYKGNITQTSPSVDTCVRLVEDGSDIVSFESCFETYDRIVLKDDTTTHQSSTVVNANFYLSEVLNTSGLHILDWSDAGGLMGLAYPSLSSLSPTHATVFEQLLLNQSSSEEATSDTTTYNHNLVGIDFNKFDDIHDEMVNEASYLHLGGLDSAKSQHMTWSVSNLDTTPSFHIFSIHHLSLCGAPLLAPIAGSWPALVDTGSTCLSLPSEIMNSFLAWLPQLKGCAHSSSSPDSSDLCYVSSAEANSLPWLSFRVGAGGFTMGSSYQGHFKNNNNGGNGDDMNYDPSDGWIHIPLYSLLLEEEEISVSTGHKLSIQKLCVIRGGDIVSAGTDVEVVKEDKSGGWLDDDSTVTMREVEPR
jgi:hypothetical protein